MAIEALRNSIDETFEKACQIIQGCLGRVIVIGVGKSGHIAAKIAATFASTGTPAFYVHAAEASHGDLGMVTRADVLLALSFSGSTPEIIAIIPHLQSLGVPIISITGNPNSPLASAATVSLLVHVKKEACPLNLAPTASTTATLVLGDALAVALSTQRGFTAEDFSWAHPGGTLGRQLSLRVKNLMHIENQLPVVLTQTKVKEALVEMSAKKMGMLLIVDAERKLLGVFSDGDIRRAVQAQKLHFDQSIDQLMNPSPKTVFADQFAGQALELMERSKITSLPVVNAQKEIIGLLHMHDILQGILEKNHPDFLKHDAKH